MTKRTRAFSQYPLPVEVDPTGERCFVIRVPDDPLHIAAFRGALGNLASAYYWADDDGHTALLAAAKWQSVIANMEDCLDINIRLKPTDFCTLQLTTDGGVTWTDVADLSDCAHAAAVDEIGAAIDRGDLTAGTQQPGDGTGTAGVCYDYDVTLSGQGTWHSPVAVGSADTIEVTNVKGAWAGVPGLGNWHCGDGSLFVLGACIGGASTEGTDPLPTELHMMLIGNLPEDTTTPYFAIFNTIYTVPTGITAGEFGLQANDSVLSDNQGALTFHVQICKGVTQCYHDDFTIDDGGWEPIATGTGSWSSSGWNGDNVVLGTQRTIAEIIKTFDTLTITRVEVKFNYHAGATNPGVNGVAIFVGSASIGQAMTSIPDADGQTFAWTGSEVVGDIILDVQSSHDSYGGSCDLVDVKVFGTGASFPTGNASC